MIKGATLAALLLLSTAACATEQAAQKAPGTADVETSGSTEILNAQVPEGWIQVVDNVVGDLAVSEYVPPDTVDVWEQKVSYEALRAGDFPLPDPLEYTQGIAAEQASRCERFHDNVVFAGFENGYQTVVHILQCGMSKLTGKPLVTMLKVILGNDSLYTVTRIWRLPAEAQTTPITLPGLGENEPPVDLKMPEGELEGWSRVLSRVKLCDSALAAHACE